MSDNQTPESADTPPVAKPTEAGRHWAQTTAFKSVAGGVLGVFVLAIFYYLVWSPDAAPQQVAERPQAIDTAPESDTPPDAPQPTAPDTARLITPIDNQAVEPLPPEPIVPPSPPQAEPLTELLADEPPPPTPPPVVEEPAVAPPQVPTELVPMTTRVDEFGTPTGRNPLDSRRNMSDETYEAVRQAKLDRFIDSLSAPLSTPAAQAGTLAIYTETQTRREEVKAQLARMPTVEPLDLREPQLALGAVIPLVLDGEAMAFTIDGNMVEPLTITATVARNIYGADGKEVVIEAGARLVGELNGALHHRVLGAWTGMMANRSAQLEPITARLADRGGAQGVTAKIRNIPRDLWRHTRSLGFTLASIYAMVEAEPDYYMQHVSDRPVQSVQKNEDGDLIPYVSHYEPVYERRQYPPTPSQQIAGEISRRLNQAATQDQSVIRIYRLERGRLMLAYLTAPYPVIAPPTASAPLDLGADLAALEAQIEAYTSQAADLVELGN